MQRVITPVITRDELRNDRNSDTTVHESVRTQCWRSVVKLLISSIQHTSWLHTGNQDRGVEAGSGNLQSVSAITKTITHIVELHRSSSAACWHWVFHFSLSNCLHWTKLGKNTDHKQLLFLSTWSAQHPNQGFHTECLQEKAREEDVWGIFVHGCWNNWGIHVGTTAQPPLSWATTPNPA